MSLIEALNHRLLQCWLIIIISRSLWWHSKHWGHLDVLTPCSSSLRSCSGTLGELRASLRHWILSSGMTYSSTSFSGRPRAVPCLAVDGMASSRMAPRSVVSWQKRRFFFGEDGEVSSSQLSVMCPMRSWCLLVRCDLCVHYLHEG